MVSLRSLVQVENVVMRPPQSTVDEGRVEAVCFLFPRREFRLRALPLLTLTAASAGSRVESLSASRTTGRGHHHVRD